MVSFWDLAEDLLSPRSTWKLQSTHIHIPSINSSPHGPGRRATGSRRASWGSLLLPAAWAATLARGGRWSQPSIASPTCPARMLDAGSPPAAESSSVTFLTHQPRTEMMTDACEQGEISLHSPPLPAHMGTGHNAAFSLQLAEETTQPFTGSSRRSLGVDGALQPSHGGSVLPNRPFVGLQPSFSSSRLGKPSMKQTEGQKTTHKNTQKPRKIGLWNNNPERSPKAWVGSRVNWCLATASFHLFKFR